MLIHAKSIGHHLASCSRAASPCDCMEDGHWLHQPATPEDTAAAVVDALRHLLSVLGAVLASEPGLQAAKDASELRSLPALGKSLKRLWFGTPTEEWDSKEQVRWLCRVLAVTEGSRAGILSFYGAGLLFCDALASFAEISLREIGLMLDEAWAAEALAVQQARASGSCWDGLATRTACCYGGSGHLCFQGEYTFERCCSPRAVALGPEAFQGFVAPKDQLFPAFLLRLRTLASPGGSAAAPVAQLLRFLLDTLSDMVNATKAGRSPKSFESAWYFMMEYYVALEALRRRLSPNFRKALVRREALIWQSFTSLVRVQWGYTDFCRCMEAAEFYSFVRSSFWRGGLPKRRFAAALLNRSRGHFQVDGKTCRNTDLIMLQPPSMFSQVFSSQCLPGDIAQFIVHGQECLLEHDLEKFLTLQRSLMQLGTVVADCLDSHFWGYTARDLAVELGKAVWQVAQREGSAQLGRSFLGRLAWAPRRGVESDSALSTGSTQWLGQPWHLQCGPHTVEGPVEVLRRRGWVGPDSGVYVGSSAFGPLCTEIGRFWISMGLRYADAAEHDRALLILPITYVSWSNPWHHMHWWLPALELKRTLGDVDLALVFPMEDADWGRSAKIKVDTSRPEAMQRSEPFHWSFLQHTWPKMVGDLRIRHLRQWKPGGFHEDVLRWISNRPPRQLQDYYGAIYSKVIMGLRPLRFQVQTSAFGCHSLSEVRAWIRATTEFRRLPPLQAAPGLAVLQRRWDRAIKNLPEILATLHEHFGPRLSISTIDNLQGLSWVQQFHRFAHEQLLLGVHGAGLAWLFAMPRGSAVMEFRPRGAPTFLLACSESWNVDGAETFGGLARLAEIHHICIKPQDVKTRFVEDLDFENWDRDENVTLHVGRVRVLVEEALQLISHGPRDCQEDL
ncbi:unnamed protein product [Effrenium voratum]|nr:unnamed protein product [Effrenium voratum]